MPLAGLRVLVDGQLRWTSSVPNESSDVTFEIPRGPDGGAVVDLDVATPFVPGGADKRALGIIVDRVSITPVNGGFVPRGHAIGMLALAVALTGLALGCCGLRGALGAVASIGVAVGYAWLMLHDAAFLGGFVDRLAVIAAGSLAAGAIVGVVRLKWPVVAGVSEWGLGAGLVLALSAIKLAVFWHPTAIVGDGIFQVHRAQVVHGGQLFFTSVTPKPFFEFPYPVALYGFALPFWNWFPTELDLLRLLRAIAIVADGFAGVLLYGAVRRQWNNRAMALWCAALWPLATAPLQALSNANLTNLFGQSMFAAALAGVAWMAAGSKQTIAAMAGVFVLLLIAFLSHFGTVTVGLATIGAVALALVAMRETRPAGVRVFAILFAAVVAAWILYYSHSTFMEVYRRSWSAVAARESDDSSKIVAAPAVKLGRWWSGSGDDYGRPGIAVLLTAALGVGWILRHRLSGAGLVFVAWLLAWLALTALGVLTPLTLRANLAAAPAFIALSAVAIGAIASRSRNAAIASVVLGALVAWDGWRVVVACLQLTTGN